MKFRPTFISQQMDEAGTHGATHVRCNTSNRWNISTVQCEKAALSLVNIDSSPPHTRQMFSLHLAELRVVISGGLD